jgi:hypothetical protein
VLPAGEAVAATPGPVASYGFGEGTGSTTGDSTGNGHTGTLSGPTWTAAGKNGNALSFDGVNDWVTVPDKDDLDLATEVTLEAWVYPTTTNSIWRTAVAKEQTGGITYALFPNSSVGRPHG